MRQAALDAETRKIYSWELQKYLKNRPTRAVFTGDRERKHLTKRQPKKTGFNKFHFSDDFPNDPQPFALQSPSIAASVIATIPIPRLS